MKHARLLACALICMTGVPSMVLADDITDAMTSPDPRTKLQSGSGAVLHSIYGPPEETALPEEAPELNTPNLSYQRSDLYKGLRGPLDEPAPAPEDLEEGAAPAPSDDNPLSTSLDLPPLGKPEQRPGVRYQDDVTTRSAR